MRDNCLSAASNHTLLDKYLPSQHIDGVPLECADFACGWCMFCMNGTCEIDVTAAACMILVAVEEGTRDASNKATNADFNEQHYT